MKEVSVRFSIPEETNYQLKVGSAQSRLNKNDFMRQLLIDYAEGKLEYKQEAKPVNLPLQFK